MALAAVLLALARARATSCLRDAASVAAFDRAVLTERKLKHHPNEGTGG